MVLSGAPAFEAENGVGVTNDTPPVLEVVHVTSPEHFEGDPALPEWMREKIEEVRMSDEENRTYFKAKIEIADTWGFRADTEATRKQVIQLLVDRLDCDVLSVEVELIDRAAWEAVMETSIDEEGEYAPQPAAPASTSTLKG